MQEPGSDEPRAPNLAAELERALIFHRRGEIELARHIYERILQLHGPHADVLHLLGVIAAQTRNPQTAVELISRAIALDPGNAAAHFNIGLSFQELKQLDAALTSYDRAIAIDSGFAAAYSNRGLVLRDMNLLDAALASCDRAISIRAEFAEAHFNRGVVLHELREWDAALASYDRAITIRADYPEAHFNRGMVLLEVERVDAALASFDRAIAYRPDYLVAHVNRGNLLMEFGRIDEALVSYDRALAIDSCCVGARLNRAILLLLQGRFEDGWRDYEWRWRKEHRLAVGAVERTLPQPLWHGKESIAGRAILLHCEQGLGDTIQFCRYAKLVAALGANVILEVQPPLLKLLEGLEGVSHLVAAGSPVPDVDYHCPLLSLPLALGTTLSTLPAHVPYLKCNPEKAVIWKQRLGDKRKFRVGLVWSGGFRPDQPELWSVNKRRNIPLAKLESLNNPDVEFYSLQKGQPAESEFAELETQGWNGPQLIDFTNLVEDFSDTAALIEQLDLVISVDTSTAHLAGAMAKPVWILNRYDSCWRWLLNRADSPWYPTARLFRQQRAGDWDGVVEQVRMELAQLTSR